MFRKSLFAAVFLFCLPLPSLAAGEPISRAEGFQAIWQTLKRPVFETREKQYLDVPKGSLGEAEITYARSRGFLSDEVEQFFPKDALTLDTAILWLLKTRNVDDLDDITPESAVGFANQYGLITRDEARTGVLPEREITAEELTTLIQTFTQALRDEVHEVSLYAEKFHGKGTAFGESFDMHALTAAHRTFPHNTLVKVTNISNGKSVLVRINDRGPFVEGRDMDLSLASFTSIESRSKGKFNAKFDRLGDVTLVGACARQDSIQKRLYRSVVLTRGVPQTLVKGGSLTLSADVPFVVLSESYPDGQKTFRQNWIMPEEVYEFTPSILGEYKFLLATREGQKKEFKMEVAECS